MTVGILSILSGVALTVSGGMPMYGMPKEFGEVFAYAAPFGIPAPVLFAAGVYAIIFYILNWDAVRPAHLRDRRQCRREPARRHQHAPAHGIDLRHVLDDRRLRRDPADGVRCPERPLSPARMSSS